MKNTKILLSLVALCALTACATTGTEQKTTQKPQINAEDLTFENVMQKSQELRNQVETAKTAYSAAQTANQATNASGNISDSVKNQVNKQLETAKQQIKNEADAWKDLAK